MPQPSVMLPQPRLILIIVSSELLLTLSSEKKCCYSRSDCVVWCVCVSHGTSELGKVEDEIFKTRRQKDMEFRRRNKEKKRRNSVSI